MTGTGTAPTPRPAPAPAALAIFEARVITHRLSRRVVSLGGRTFQLFEAVPVAKAPPAGHPLLYLLDGNAAFDALTPALLSSVPGLALAGIGYDTPLRFHVAERSRDYTPPRGPADPSPDPLRPERSIGGAALFLDLLVGGLREVIEEGRAIDPARRTLWGHSLAGLFTLYALLLRPPAFARYAAASPSVWWGDEMLLGLEERTAFPEGSEAEVLVMLGDSERRSNPAGPHWDGPAPHTLEMVERLRRRPGLDVTMEIFDGLGHAATLATSLPHALTFAAGMDASSAGAN